MILMIAIESKAKSILQGKWFCWSITIHHDVFLFIFLTKYFFLLLMIRYNIFFYLISENFNFIYHVYISYDLIDHYTKRIREIKYSIREVYFLFVIRTNFWKLIHSFIHICYSTPQTKKLSPEKHSRYFIFYHVRWPELFIFFLEKAPYIYMRTNWTPINCTPLIYLLKLVSKYQVVKVKLICIVHRKKNLRKLLFL